VVFAGPAMNLLFPVLLYFSVFLGEGPFSPPTVGVVLPGHPAEGILRPGDRILAVNGEEVGTFDEVRRRVEQSPGQRLQLLLFRDSRHELVEVTASEERRALALDLTARVGSLGIQPNMPAPVVGISSPDSPAFRAGLRSFDWITFVAGRPIRSFRDLEAEFGSNRGETIPVTYLRPTRVAGVLGGLADLAVFEAGVVALTPHAREGDLLLRTGMESVDLFVAAVPAGSYLFKAGLRPGDRLVNLDEQPLAAWSSFVSRLSQAPEAPHRLDFVSGRDGKLRSGTFQVRREDFLSAGGEKFSRYVLPCGSWSNLVEKGASSCEPGTVRQWLPLALEERVDHPSPARYALTRTVDETLSVSRFVAVALVRLVQGRIRLEELSGPLHIYELTGEERRKGNEHFIWVMALVSINLGLLNLLPIPVLDGGHLLFFALEGVLRHPLPLRVRELLHVAGMAFLLFIMGIAFKNDVVRRWEVLSRLGTSDRKVEVQEQP